MPKKKHDKLHPPLNKAGKRMEAAAKEMLEAIGEDPAREGLTATPARVARAFQHLTAGYSVDVGRVINHAVFTEENLKDMVVVTNIELYSLCEHHMLPFFGKAHVGYIPKNKIVGLSIIPRVVDVFARRLQLQERLTHQIAQTLWDHLDPLGVGVVIEARHLCMMMRGVEKQNSAMKTSCMLGQFRKSIETRSEFLSLVGV
ncbi:MAG: GTP cyclohydrolase I FolE [Chitinivibrionales bacterium]|nr:GTP cyclohydrolase I FolE [Chitinivibrionales bacterium]MBD3355908.1 GTP cyclohydrolase I FolE [Chitinivibrionales bacterium]